MKIGKCQVNHVSNPMGFMLKTIVFSYQIEAEEGCKQTFGQIRVCKDPAMIEDVYDSGYREDMDSVAFCADLMLAPRTRYYWTVTVESDAGETAASSVNWFETGKMDEPWEGKWVTSPFGEKVHPIVFQNLPCNKEIKSARLYICGLGLYEAYINGEKIGDEILTPYCNNYDRWLQYQTYDITQQLGVENKLEVLLGNGWYKGRFGLDDDGTTENLYGDHFLLIAEVHIDYADGSHQVVGTDESWLTRKSKCMDSSFYNGETWDETFRSDETTPVLLWDKPMAPLTERLSLPIRVQETLMPVREIHTSKGELVLDLGQNHSGWFELKIHEPVGTKVSLYFGEELQDGCFYNGNLRTGKQEYHYISDGEPHTIRPHFTSYGYRYVKLVGFTNFKIEDYTGMVIYSDLEQTAYMETGSNLVNRLLQNALWGQKSNFLDVPMDCPQRDERMGWTGDAQVFSATACYQMDSQAFYKKYLYDMYQEQLQLGGGVPFCVPACGQKSIMGVWGDAATIIPWNVYLTYGDKSILADQFDSMKSWVDYIRAFNGNDWRWLKTVQFADWNALDSKKNGLPTGATDTGFVATVYYYNSARLVAKAARVLGRVAEETAYNALADELYSHIRNEYFSPNGRACVNTQTGLLMALHFDLCPDRGRTVMDLRKEFKENEDKLVTGFVGTSMLCGELSENGMDDLAYSLLLFEGNPGWLYSVKKGATTIWERWDSLDENGHFSENGLNSLNHYSYGSIAGWLYCYGAGMQTVEEAPGFRVMKLEPHPDYRLGKIDATLKTAVGTYRSAWRVSDSFGLILDITVPFGGEARLRIPFAPSDLAVRHAGNPLFAKEEEGVYILSPGTYYLEYQTSVPMRKAFSLDSTIAELLSDGETANILTTAIPMISMLPSVMHDKTFRDVLGMLPVPIPAERVAEIEKILSHC